MLLACLAMGTRFELLLVDDERPERELRSIGELVLAEIVELDARLSRFLPDSLLAHIGRQPLGVPVRVAGHEAALFAEAVAVFEASGGLFDSAYAEHGRAEQAGRPLLPSFQVDTDRCTVTRLRDAPLDFGGIAKGHAVDSALALLREHGVRAAFLHGGTSAVGAIGSPPEGDGWLVQIAVPASVALAGLDPEPTSRFRVLPRFSAAARPCLMVHLLDECLAVSAPHGRTSVGGHHIIDPRTGESAHGAAIAAIVGPSCRTCDAWTKPALIERARPRGLPAEYRVWVGG